MVDCERVLQDEMARYGPSLALGVDAAVPPLWTGPNGAGPTSSEYSLGFKTTLVLQWLGQTANLRLRLVGRSQIPASERTLPSGASAWAGVQPHRRNSLNLTEIPQVNSKSIRLAHIR